ncbi:MAG TPA: hypothetical protein VF159_09670 [Gemmatimonadaceae bacterium]
MRKVRLNRPPRASVRWRARALTALALGAVVASVSCENATAPQQKSSNDLHFLRVATGAPALAVTTASFWAKVGQGSGLDIWYKPKAGESDSTKFLEFRLDGESLSRKPNGLPFAPGDSILITVTIPDPTQLVVQFSPSGLSFSSEHPAKLKLFFGECGDDLNHDGSVDREDGAAAQQLSIWRQEAVGQPWFKVLSAVLQDQKEVDATLSGFTGYALAY